MRTAADVAPCALWLRGDPVLGAVRDDTVRLQQAVSGNGRRALWPSVPRLDRVFHSTFGADPLSGDLPRGRGDTPGGGRAHGRDIGTDRGTRAPERPAFALEPRRNGYAWWYVDGISADGAHGITIIAFIGSVFSPYYARARRKGRGVPQNHVAMNVALYGKRARAWTMTERGAAALRQSETALQIGPSSMHWDGTALHIEIEEVAVPFIRRVKGSVRVTPICLPGREFRLDSAGTQIWQPIAPIAHIEVNMTSPSLSWSGTAYFDHNRGTQPLESSFHRWDWSRQATPHSTRIR